MFNHISNNYKIIAIKYYLENDTKYVIYLSVLKKFKIHKYISRKTKIVINKNKIKNKSIVIDNIIKL
jgi:hypothetical protein